MAAQDQLQQTFAESQFKHLILAVFWPSFMQGLVILKPNTHLK